jgi:hypothetical protein
LQRLMICTQELTPIVGYVRQKHVFEQAVVSFGEAFERYCASLRALMFHRFCHHVCPVTALLSGGA